MNKNARLLLGLELLAVTLWVLIVTRPYLNLDPMQIPTGGEYLSIIQSYHFWARVKQCGMCGLWDGTMQGGVPALANPYTSMLHPLVIVTNMVFGVRNGIKLALIGCFVLGGIAQWWLAYTLGVGRVGRTWSAGAAVVSGHLSGVMELGAVGLVISTATCTLVLPALITFVRSGSRRMAAVLGVVLAMAALSGQGYMQICLLVLLPLVVVLIVPIERARFLLLARRSALAGVLALLLAAPLLLPFVHFLPEFAKKTDPELHFAQPLTYTLFNLVIDDVEFYKSKELRKDRQPWLYMNFVGWIPLAFAVWGVCHKREGHTHPNESRTILYLLATAMIPLLLASDGTLKMLANAVPLLAEPIYGVRYYPLMAKMAVPPLLALAALGVDKLVARPAPLPLGEKLTPQSAPENTATARFSFDLRWLLVVPLAVALLQMYTFSQNWIKTREVPSFVEPTLEALRTPDIQWVSTHHRIWNYDLIEPAIRDGLKLSNGFRTWRWKDHPDPQPVLAATAANDLRTDMRKINRIGKEIIFAASPGHEYAAVLHPDGSRTVCRAYGTGGFLDVHCTLEQGGTLSIKENNWRGWHAWVDGKKTEVQPERWLTVNILSAGEHLVMFRYRPLDAMLGIGLCLAGVVLTLVIWWRG